ncbi:MAG: hypothetical protein OSA92_02200 [Pirellulaceae bacterium]|nr:hypothetical protein [Pirellulaceae bacterium]
MQCIQTRTKRVIGLPRFSVLLVLLAFLVDATTVRQVQAAIPRNVKIELDQRLIPAYRTGHLGIVVYSGAMIVNQVGGTVNAEINEYLAGQGIETLGVVLARSRFSLMAQNKSVKPAVTKKELLITVPHFQAEVEKLISGELRPMIMKMAADAADHPKELVEFERVLWDLHVYKNDLVNLGRTAEMAGRTVLLVLQNARLRDTERKALSFDFQAVRQTIEAEVEKRLTWEMSLRAQRIELALGTLGDSPSLKVRLQAAFAMDQDIKIIRAFVEQQRKGNFAGVPQPNLREFERAVAFARGTHQELFRSADQLYTGLHWWLRGRYGKGIAADGLLKGEHVKKVPASGFALRMPRDRAKAIDPFAIENNLASPYVGRRHEYIWSWENGGIKLEYGTLSVVAKSEYFY